jgi:hypothetical protein
MIRSAGYGPRYPNPFEPWPRVPGDIWGYPAPRPIEHPIGHESIQTGPNTWTYRPLYAAEVVAPGEAAEVRTDPRANQPAPQAKMRLPGPSNRSESAPQNPGPREF